MWVYSRSGWGIGLGYQAASLSDYQLSTLPLSFSLTSGYVCVCGRVCVCLAVPAACRAVALLLTPQNIIFNYLSRSVWLLSPSNFRQEKDNIHTHTHAQWTFVQFSSLFMGQAPLPLPQSLSTALSQLRKKMLWKIVQLFCNLLVKGLA